MGLRESGGGCCNAVAMASGPAVRQRPEDETWRLGVPVLRRPSIRPQPCVPEVRGAPTALLALH
eukprot:12136075-Alexandrium_andersonii.AAC.1